jgi:hypothetical protein
MSTADGGQLPGLLEERMLDGPVMMTIRWHSARDGATRLTKPVPYRHCPASLLAWRLE